MRILHNARIYTLQASDSVCSAIAIDQDRVIATGDRETIISQLGSQAEIFDLGGRTVIPGLTDAHIHLQHYALGLQKVNCETSTKSECLRRVAERVGSTPAGEWILGHGWNQNDWESGFGTLADLDAIAPDHPVNLTAKSLHASWANSQALRRSNITPNTPDPSGGQVGRDERGLPNGILFENAMQLVAQAIPEPSVEVLARTIQQAIPALWRMGLTGVHDFDRRNCFSALQLLRQRGDLQFRVAKSIPWEDLHHAIALGLRTGFGDDFLRIGSLKGFSDGALGPHTAAMLQPYEDDPANRGMLLLDAEEIYEKGRLAVENGLSLAIHAIGDRANHEVLNALTQIRRYEREEGLAPLRHRIEHVQLLHPDDASRLAELGITASMQPVHATSDMLMSERFWGPRSKLAYAWRAQVDRGAVLAFGSDAPVESPNPFLGLYAAVTRRRTDGTPGSQGWYPEQRLTLMDALQAYTYGAAYAVGAENSLGRLAPGYLSDLLVLDTDIFNCNLEQLPEIRPSAVMVSGQWVYQE